MVGEKDKKNNNILSAKDHALFKNVVKFYTSKQYKKGLKAADQILKSNPEHGETLSMKGLIFNCMDKKAEAYEFVRKGLRADLSSHVCWHTYGLVYRSDRNYAEAIKCYLNALRHEPDSLQILRDLSLLQIQMRDLQGYHDTRRKILSMKSGQENNWIAFAMSAHLLGNHDLARLILSQCELIKSKAEKLESQFEHSELLLYKNLVIEESGKYNEALEHIQSIESQVVDKQAWKEKRASLLLINQNYSAAEEEYRALIKQNPENQTYHRGLIAAKLSTPATNVDRYEGLCRNLSEEQITTLETLYATVTKDHPRSLLARRIPLEFLRGDKFQAAFAAYLHPNLRKGVPSLFAGVKALYHDEEKKQQIDAIVKKIMESLTSRNVFGFAADGATEEVEPPSTLLWTLFFAAQHNDKLNNHAEALKLIAKAIAHTPTAIELHMQKAKILKHAGDPFSAWKVYEAASDLDLADRYLNTKATLYALRADQMEAAEKTIAVFTTKEGIESQELLFDMQCMWYETEAAASYLRTGDLGRALKKFVAVDKHFGDILEDQFDFHSYCLRKMTLRSYLALLRLEDQLYGLRYYRIAAKGIVRAYLTIFDHPQVLKKEGEKEETKAEQAKKKQAKKETPAASKDKAKANAKPREVDEDPRGEKLATVADPLGEAQKYLRTLRKYAPNDVEVQLLSAKVNLRRKKYLQVVQALNNAIKVDPDLPEIPQLKAELATAVAGLTADDIVTSILREEVAKLLQGKTVAQTVEESVALLVSNKRGYSSRVVAAELLSKFSPEKKAEALAFLQDENALRAATHADAKAALDFISREFTTEQAAAFREKSHSIFPLASSFGNTSPLSPSKTPNNNNNNNNNNDDDSYP